MKKARNLFRLSLASGLALASLAASAAGEGLTLDLGEVREIAHVWLNGEDLGVRFMPPYEYALPKGAVRPTGNRLVVEVTNLGANRLRWNDLNGVRWKYFRDANVLSPNYRPLDASKWPVRTSGLIGPVVLRAESGELWYTVHRKVVSHDIRKGQRQN